MAEEVLEKEAEQVEEPESEAAETETEEEKKNKLMAWIEKHPKAFFWIRLGLWLTFAGLIPFTFIALRFKLFQKISKLQFGGWGVIAIIILALVAFTVIKYIKLAFSNRYSLIAQILTGFCKIIIPLLAFWAILISTRDNTMVMIKVMGVVIVSEAIAIPLNPLPKWAYEMQKDVRVSERKEALDYMLDGFFKRKKEEETSGE